MISKKIKILLASKSPRRRELLSQMNVNFDIIRSDVDESYPKKLAKSKITEFICNKKLENINLFLDNYTIVITSDTLVLSAENHPLGKPKDYAEAKQMLQKLSGKKHKVFTSVGFKSYKETKIFTDCAKVEFGEISDKEIDFYIRNFNPKDKAGSYGIQDWLGLVKIRQIKGSFYSIMGFPTHIVYDYLKDF